MKRIALTTALALSFVVPAVAEDAAQFNILLQSSQKTAASASTKVTTMSVSSTSGSNARSNVHHEPVGR
ncbi:hypothetical protein ACFFUT_02635 [Pseudohalocynthiibacter aestuariivivens]|jgi:hypothetical protein|uniref:Uncharacterized protein n=1 Tax=Pseudohalocynthiibacter aestuariivivens TaxID=1591409 RepID=A0ABV5JDV8_9RHOB|nr:MULTISPECIES: hypothetical protein [Pseudohalocynthiibacter]MBS9715762.1 hypothetical protein [Pseudohalocynthiibacter aestuariivivens]MCK0101375.1 hypothetical protein [Pseudohalocynthiibacter sp. F2068]